MINKYGLLMAATGLSFIILLIDIMFPLGVAGGILLISVVLLGLWFPQAKQILVIMCVAAALTVAGYLLSPSGSDDWVVFTNRAMTIFALLLTGTILYFHKSKNAADSFVESESVSGRSSNSFEIIGAWRATGALATIMLVMVITFLAVKETERTLAWVTHTRQVQADLAKVLSKLQDAETGQRGFLLTGEDQYLEPFEGAINEIVGSIVHLQNLTKDNPSQTLNTKTLLVLAKDKIDELNQTIDLRRDQGLSAALDLVKTDVGKKLMDNIRQVIERIDIEETRLLAERESKFYNLRYFATAAFLLLLGLTISFPVYLVKRVRQFSEYREKSDRLLETAKFNAEQANKAKSKFLSSMSHELRTPMNAILGFTQLIRIDSTNPLSEKQMGETDHVLKAGNHLLKLIDDVLDLSKIEAGHLDINKSVQNPAPIIEECSAVANHLISGKKVTFIDQTEGLILPEIDIDGTRFRQVLTNLLSNAIKYNRQNGTVTLTATTNNFGWLRFVISDTGLGIPDDKRDQVFEPFSRLGMENSEISGSGIGLSITRQLVTEMGGEIGFASYYNVGSRFWIDFPIVSGEISPVEIAGNVEAAIGRRSESGKKQILCVEDDPMSLLVMNDIVENILGMEMMSAHTGELGLEIAQSVYPDAILMDINLPGITGLEALERLRSSDLTHKIPVIAITSRASDEEMQEGLDAGFDAYLTKPVNIEKVATTIKTAIRASRDTPDQELMEIA